ncbi:uncharacterized protein LOC130995671 [Salvia miltiorrhiza]|uniref:uncharacterized protein LOC130995671 n=1 Tax=Salvia miltiorrhiza TaxID=226208 RepID=UPI0025ACBE51|nr:uncharacterized protein LOC130995671 [Salvia miltiorrhiza]
MFVIDSSVQFNHLPVGTNYDLLCDVFPALLSEFLNDNGEHLSAASVAKSTIEVVQLNWANKKNTIDSSLYLMRHMETFAGDTSTSWMTGLLNAENLHLHILRMRYCVSIISWDKNKFKDRVLMDSSATYGSELAVNPTKFDGISC